MIVAAQRLGTSSIGSEAQLPSGAPRLHPMGTTTRRRAASQAVQEAQATKRPRRDTRQRSASPLAAQAQAPTPSRRGRADAPEAKRERSGSQVAGRTKAARASAEPTGVKGKGRAMATAATAPAAATSAAPIPINRAPVLTLWAAVVAQRQGFSWEEALTFGKQVSGILAQSKGRSLGIYEEKERSEASAGGTCTAPLPANTSPWAAGSPEIC